MNGVVYRHFSKTGELLYIGSSVCFHTRTSAHKSSSGWFDEIASITVEHFSSAQEARAAEKMAISVESPRENFVFKPKDMFRRPAKCSPKLIDLPHPQLDAVTKKFMISSFRIGWYLGKDVEGVNEIRLSGRKLTKREIRSLHSTLGTTYAKLAEIGLDRKEAEK